MIGPTSFPSNYCRAKPYPRAEPCFRVQPHSRAQLFSRAPAYSRPNHVLLYCYFWLWSFGALLHMLELGLFLIFWGCVFNLHFLLPNSDPIYHPLPRALRRRWPSCTVRAAYTQAS